VTERIRTEDRTPSPPPGTDRRSPTAGERLARLAARPWVILAVLGIVILAMSWQFITDASRAVPAFDTAFYQWRVEYLLEEDPGSLIELRGAVGALAGGYRIAEPVTGALMRTVGGVAPGVPTIVLSIVFRVLAAAGMASFAWKHRRNLLLFYLTLVSIPALFFLQRFFGYMDNFMTLAMIAAVLLLMDRMATSWGARIGVTILLFLAGMSHPTTLVIFLMSMGAVAVYRVLRQRSLLAALRSEGMIVATGTVAVVLTAAFWLGGLWGPTSSFSDAAVPPPEDVAFFVDRSIGVLKNLEPLFPFLVLFPLMAVGLGHLVVKVVREREWFAVITVAWTVPLLGMLGFVVGAAYPYFRFFNATLAPLLLATLALTLLILWPLKLRGTGGRILSGAAVVAVALIIGVWWQRGLSAWNTNPTWLTPEIRETMAAASAYLDAEPQDRRALFVTDAQPGDIVPYGQYKEHANAIHAGLDGDQIADTTLFFGRIEDLEAGRPSTSSDQPYNDISADTSEDVIPLLDREAGNVVVFIPAVFNEHSTNAEFLASCQECVSLGESGLVVVPDVSGTEAADGAVAAANQAAEDARAFASDPPGPLENLGGSSVAAVRLGILFLLPGWLFYRRLDRRSWPEAVALVPLLGIASTTAIGVVLVAILRTPFTPVLGWATVAIAVILALFWRLPEGLRRRRDVLFAAPARIIDDTAELFRNRDFSSLMFAQWLAQAADGLVGVALAKEITFGGQAGFNLDLEAARSPRDALLIVLLTFLPYTLFSPFVGVLIDRWNRRRILIAANGLRVVVLGLIAAVGITAFGDAALYVSFLLILAGTRLVLAIRGAGMPTALGEQRLIQGNSISQAGSAIFQIGGAGVALVGSAFLSSRLLVVGGVIVYALATAAAFRVRRLGTVTEGVPLRQELGRLVGDVVEGIREVGRRAMAGLALASFLTVRTVLTFVTLATVFVSREFIATEGTVTTAIPAAAGALGAAVGFVVAQFVKDRVPPARIVVGALLVGAAGMLAFGGIINLLGISVLAFSVGLSFFLGKIGVDTMMQQALADTYRGRGFSLQDIAYNLSWVIPAVVLFVFLSRDTARILLVVAGLVFLAIAVGIALWARRIGAGVMGTGPPPRT
jgi:hypothetical protein